MRRTFVCDESMVITIPLGTFRDAREGQLMPEKFHCVFRDFYKLFIIRGKPKPLGAAQVTAGVFLVTLGLVFNRGLNIIYTLPSIVYVITGMLTYAAGKYPNMHVAKLSFSLNIISFFWSIAAFVICVVTWSYPGHDRNNPLYSGVNGLIVSLLAVENVLALFLIYWLSKAVCRQHFNILPTILLKQAD
ncbi:uncharacterized protein LOC125016273 [Mugil cephalus]|uniref:uncharacterized protein LOC125016273 n=1 Tax=Mugil cephalus TaxID=48193 RepID=UPI001FB6419E|nr:uncharacterized protein LOC125016273 [Mugil cephalus]